MSISFSKDSWHYKFVRKMTRYYTSPDASNICTYTRAFLFALLKLAFFIVLGTAGTILIGAIILVPMAAAAVNLFCHLFHLTVPAWVLIGKILAEGVVVWCVVGGILLGSGSVFAFLVAKRKYRDYRYANPLPVKEPSALATMYDHWHDKTCAKIEFTDTVSSGESAREELRQDFNG